MKRVLCTTLTLLLASTVFVACQKDGIFNPKQKISKVYQAYYGNPRLTEKWTWDDNLLNCIAYFRDDTTVQQKSYYFYEKKQLVKIDNTYDLSYILITYDKSFYKQIESYDKFDRKLRSYAFTYDKKKITKMEVTIYKNPSKAVMSAEEGDIMSVFIPKAILDETNKLMSVPSLLKSAENDLIVYTMQYDGDNISEWKIANQVGGKTKEIVFQYNSYDENKNPYYTSYPNMNENEPASPAFFKNNPLKITCTEYFDNAKISSYTYDYTYKYDAQKYPIEAIKNLTQDSYFISDTLYYEYQ